MTTDGKDVLLGGNDYEGLEMFYLIYDGVTAYVKYNLSSHYQKVALDLRPLIINYT